MGTRTVGELGIIARRRMQHALGAVRPTTSRESCVRGAPEPASTSWKSVLVRRVGTRARAEGSVTDVGADAAPSCAACGGPGAALGPAAVGTLRPVRSRGPSLGSPTEVVDVGNDAVIVESVRSWAARELPGEPVAEDRAVAVALDAYQHGESLAEACREGRRFVGSWSRHPSHRPIHHQVPIAS